MSNNLQEHFDSILKKVENLESSIVSVKISLKKLESEFLKPDYAQVDGITGKFNGYEIMTESGERIPVPQNYAAKSRLVYGDILKKIEEEGKTIFKQVQKVDRHQVEGILTKKEGEWYLLTDRGSYKVLDTAAEFLKAEINSEALAFLPADDLECPFATLDKLISTQYLVNSAYIKKEEKTENVNIESKVEHTPQTIKDKKPSNVVSVKHDLKHEQKKDIREEKKPFIKKQSKSKVFRGTDNKNQSKEDLHDTSTKPQDVEKNRKLDDDDLI